jgi:hypothetical protein
MITTMPTGLKSELKKLAGGTIIALAEVLYPDDPTKDIIIARNLEAVAWNGKTWLASWFEIDPISQNKTPELWVRIDNVGGAVEKQCRDRGNLDGLDCSLYFISHALLSETYPISSFTFNIMKVVYDRDVVSVKLSVQNPMMLNCPTTQIHGSICQYPKFPGDPRCQYYGPLTTCNRTLADCLIRWPYSAPPLPRWGGATVCTYTFGDANCGYVITAYPTCDKSPEACALRFPSPYDRPSQALELPTTPVCSWELGDTNCRYNWGGVISFTDCGKSFNDCQARWPSYDPLPFDFLNCPYTFKDANCGYDGTRWGWCGKSYAHCLERFPQYYNWLIPFGGQLGILGELQDESDL